MKLNKGELKISVIYVLIGSAWILFSDQLLNLIVDSQIFDIVVTFKGWLFIGCTGLMLYQLIRRLLEKEMRHEEEIHRLNQLYDVLSKVNRKLSTAQSEEELYQEVCNVFVTRSKVKLAWIGRHDVQNTAIIPVAWAGEPEEFVHCINDFSLEGLGLTGMSVRMRQSYVCNDFFADYRTIPWRESARKAGIQASASFVFHIGQVIGTLNVYASERNSFQEKEVALLEEVALAISFGLEHLSEEEQRRRAEDALRKMNEELEAKVEARTQALMGMNEELIAMNEEITIMNEKINKAKQEAEQANLAKSDFLAKMSHEIRTPINAIVGLNYLMQKTKLTEKQKEYVSKTILSANNLQVIINDVLDFAKIEANKVVLESIDFDLYEILSNISNIISINVYEKKLKLYFSVDSAAPQFLKGDPFRLQQVLLNLANNAVKFTHEGEISIFVTILAKDDQEVSLEFTVKDTGIGIPLKQQSGLFEAFSQMDMSTTRKYGGTGLGLAISKTIIELMDGTIRVESQVDKGSSFIFNLTFGYADNAEYFAPALSNLKFIRVLLVSKNEELQRVLKRQLDQFGFICTVAESYGKALQGGIQYDLIFIDQNLDKDVVKDAAMISKEFSISVPIIMLVSAYRNRELQAKAEKALNEFGSIIYYPVGQSQLYNEIIKLFEHVLTGENKLDADAHNRFTVLRGVRVLLVEDNEINQQVAKEIMEDKGIAVDIAEDGQQAVELASRNVYDIVLMDIQMPVLDGYAATKLLRELPNFRDIPIVALTADVVRGVADKVFASGMDGYITKPIEPLQLLATLKRWLYKEPSNLLEEYKPSKRAAIPIQALPGLNIQAGLGRINGKTERYLELLTLFKEKHARSAEKIKSALEADKQIFAVRIAHTLKGAAGNIGLDDVFSAAAKLEKILQDNPSVRHDLPELNALAEALQIAEHSIGTALKELNAKIDQTLVNPPEINEKLNVLKDRIELNQVDALDMFKELSHQIKEQYGLKQLEALKGALENFDWDYAGELLNSMRGGECEPGKKQSTAGNTNC